MQGNEIEKSVTEIESGNGKYGEFIDLSTSSRGQSLLSFRPKRSGVEKSIIETKSGNGKLCELIDLSIGSRGHNPLSFGVEGNGIEKSVIETKSGNGKYGELIDLSASSRGQTMTPSVTSGHLPHGGRLELSLRDGYGVNEKTNSTFIPLNEGESEERAGGVCVRRPVSFETGLGRILTSKSNHGPLKTRYGFTLVELIVVIVIVGVLATIAFLAFGNYPKQARDVVRISNLQEIEKAIEFYKIKDGDYPIPTGGQTNTGVIEGYSGIVWYKGTFGENLANQIESVTKLPTDPKDNTEYIYELTEDLQSYRLTANLEIKNKETGTKQYIAKSKIIGYGSCKDLLDRGLSVGDGIYTIFPTGEAMQVYCDMTTKGGGWTRISNSLAEIRHFNGNIVSISNGVYTGNNIPQTCPTSSVFDKKYNLKYGNIKVGFTEARLDLTKTTTVIQCASITDNNLDLNLKNGIKAEYLDTSDNTYKNFTHSWGGIGSHTCAWNSPPWKSDSGNPVLGSSDAKNWKIYRKIKSKTLYFRSACGTMNDNGNYTLTLWVR